MDIDEEMRRKIVVSLVAAVLVVFGFLAIGATYGGNNGFTPTGGYALIGAIITFVLVMAGAGLYLARSG